MIGRGGRVCGGPPQMAFIEGYATRPMNSRGVRAFSRLSREQAEALAEMVDERVILRSLDFGRVRSVTGPGFSDDDISGIARLYFDLMLARLGDVSGTDLADRTDLDADKRTVLAVIADKILDKVDSSKIRENLTLATLLHEGHPHVQHLSVYTEFRPFSLNGKIVRVVPHLVVNGIVHESARIDSQPVKFQLDLASARRLVDDLKAGIDALQDEIKDMRDKFGGEVVID